jgi:hypothetical protein
VTKSNDKFLNYVLLYGTTLYHTILYYVIVYNYTIQYTVLHYVQYVQYVPTASCAIMARAQEGLMFKLGSDKLKANGHDFKVRTIPNYRY